MAEMLGLASCGVSRAGPPAHPEIEDLPGWIARRPSIRCVLLESTWSALSTRQSRRFPFRWGPVAPTCSTSSKRSPVPRRLAHSSRCVFRPLSRLAACDRSVCVSTAHRRFHPTHREVWGRSAPSVPSVVRVETVGNWARSGSAGSDRLARPASLAAPPVASRSVSWSEVGRPRRTWEAGPGAWTPCLEPSPHPPPTCLIGRPSD